MNIPNRYKDVEFSNIHEEIQKIVIGMKEERKGLFLYGGCGTGKTYAVYAIKKYLEENKLGRVMIHNTSEFIKNLQNNFNISERRDWTGWSTKDIQEYGGITVLDDMGSEMIKDWVRTEFQLIINSIYNDVKPIIITSNYSLTELAERVGDRIASRIAGMCEVIKLEGGDKRF